MFPKARPNRLYLMNLATAPTFYGEHKIAMTLSTYLIQMDDGSNILIDTGMPVGFTSPLVPTPKPGENLLDQLARIGLGPNDINQVIVSHLDMDHAGQNHAFPNAEFIIQREHYELALAGHERLQTIRKYWDRPELRYRLVDGDATVHRGVELITTPGHVAGHQAVLVRMPETGSVLLPIDAVSLRKYYVVDKGLGPYDEDVEALRESTQKLVDLAAAERDALVVFGHDGDQWANLRVLPDFYR